MSDKSEPDETAHEAVRRATTPAHAAVERAIEQLTAPTRIAAERAVEQLTAPTRIAAERALEQITAPSRIAAERAMQQLAAMSMPSIPDPNARLAEQMRRALENHVRIVPLGDPFAVLQDRILRTFTYSTDPGGAAMSAAFNSLSEQWARTASVLATSTVVRLAADPQLSDALTGGGPDAVDGAGPTITAEDVHRIVAAQVGQLTGGKPEGWRWLLTPEGIMCLIMAIIALYGVVQDAVNNAQDDSSKIVVNNSPGATVNVWPSGSTPSPAEPDQARHDSADAVPQSRHPTDPDGCAEQPPRP